MIALRTKLETPGRGWLRRLRANGFTARRIFDRGQNEGLKRRLLSIAGAAVVLPRIEEDLRAILRRGKTWRGYNAVRMPGEPCRCHSNSAALWAANAGALDICTGYALSRDGLWRQHSWCLIRETGRVVETTVRRVLYHGIVLCPSAAERFLHENP